MHEAWIDLPAGNPMLIADGFETTNQKVWSETITPDACTTPGSKITYDFTVNAMNVLRADWNGGNNGGANLELKINGQSIGSQDLTSNNPGQVVVAVSIAVSPDPTYGLTCGLVGPVGLEPTTRGLKVRCSAN